MGSGITFFLFFFPSRITTTTYLLGLLILSRFPIENSSFSEFKCTNGIDSAASKGNHMDYICDCN